MSDEKQEMSATATELKEKIRSKSAVVSVIGLGYVGLPLAVEKAKVGFKVLGVEQNPERADMINRGENYIGDVKDNELKDLAQKGLLSASTSFDCLPNADVIIICVPTPLTVNFDPDISYIVSVCEEIAPRLRPGQLVTLESTTFPGTTEEVMLPLLQKSGLKIGEEFFLAFSPERVDPGNKRYTTKNTSKVVGGVTPTCLDVAKTFYDQTIINVVPVSSPSIAEMTKVFENTYRSINIALVNEIMLLCDRMGLDVWEVVEAAGTKPFGIQTFYPGPGVGGHCIPIDPFYLTWRARQFDFHTRFIELAGEINIQASYHVVDVVSKTLNKAAKCLNGSKILLLGVAYKKDISDVRESPALKIIELLWKEHADVSYHDPYVPHLRAHEPYNWEMEGVSLSAEKLQEADCVLIATDHSDFDYDWIVENSKIVVDTRNAARGVKNHRDKIVKI
jgi:UDP-N-acetyl-D-glucosamine dehydrogenase